MQFYFDGSGIPVESMMLVIAAVAVVVLAFMGVCVLINANRYLAAMISEKKGGVKEEDTALSTSAAVSMTGAVDPSVKDLEVIAAISAAITAFTGGSVNITSVTSAQSSGVTTAPISMWRAAGIAECMGSRLASRSW